MTLISGITFIKNGITLGYPIRESIKSIENLCDEIIINVGFTDPECTEDDGTYDLLRSSFTGDKFIFLKSYWDPSLSIGGQVLAEQTNIALDRASGKYCQYIQGDECLHENDIENIKKEVLRLENDLHIDGLVFHYTHFYGNVDIIKQTKKTYRRELRLIRNTKNVKSWRDAQGFRKLDDSKLICRQIEARVYHYGWARLEQIMEKKTESFEKLYHGEDHKIESFKYERIWGLRPFKGTHPKVMNEWIKTHENDVDILSMPAKLKLSDIRLILSDSFEFATGIRLGEYINFKLRK